MDRYLSGYDQQEFDAGRTETLKKVGTRVVRSMRVDGKPDDSIKKELLEFECTGRKPKRFSSPIQYESLTHPFQ